MLRVFQAAVVLMGGLLLMITGMVGMARENATAPLRWMIVNGTGQGSSQGLYALYAVEPVTKTTRRISDYAYQVDLIGQNDTWSIYAATVLPQPRTVIYRTHLGLNPTTLIEGVSEFDTLVSINGEWVITIRFDPVNQRSEYVSISVETGIIYPLFEGLEHLSYVAHVASDFIAISPDGEWLAFLAEDKSGNLDLFRTRLDGRGLENLTVDLAEALVPIGWIDEGIIAQVTPKSLYLIDPSQGITSVSFNDFGFGDYPFVHFLNGKVQLLFSPLESGRTTSYLVQAYTIPDKTLVWEAGGFLNYSLSPDMRQILLTYSDLWVIRDIDSGQVQASVYPVQDWNSFISWSPDAKAFVGIALRRTSNLLSYLPANGEGEMVVSTPNGSDNLRFEAWGPTIDRPYNGNALAGIGVILCGVGAALWLWRFRKV